MTAGALLIGAPVDSVIASASGISGCPVFPADDVWNTDISALPVHRQSSAWLANMGGPSRNLHPDFGSSGDPSAPYGIPFTVVDSHHAAVDVTFQYSDESDHVPYPFGPDTPIEGGQNSSGDRHALMINRDTCTLYELYNAQYSSNGSTAGSGAVFNLRADGPLRPAGWTSADAAGLPIVPGLLRLDEVNAGSVGHAIRFTAQETDRSYIWPARHQAGARSDPSLPPMGARFRLQAGYDISRFSPITRVVLTAMKHYGLILADNGSNWYFQGAADNNWDSRMIAELKTVPAGAFDAIDESSLMVDPNSGQARQPGPAVSPQRPVPPPPSPAGAPPPQPTPSPSPGALALAPSPSAQPGGALATAPPGGVGSFPVGRILIIAGVVILAIGILVQLGVPLGRLPGDVKVGRGGFFFYSPLATGILISIVLTILLNLLLRR